MFLWEIPGFKNHGYESANTFYDLTHGTSDKNKRLLIGYTLLAQCTRLKNLIILTYKKKNNNNERPFSRIHK